MHGNRCCTLTFLHSLHVSCAMFPTQFLFHALTHKQHSKHAELKATGSADCSAPWEMIDRLLLSLLPKAEMSCEFFSTYGHKLECIEKFSQFISIGSKWQWRNLSSRTKRYVLDRFPVQHKVWLSQNLCFWYRFDINVDTEYTTVPTEAVYP